MILSERNAPRTLYNFSGADCVAEQWIYLKPPRATRPLGRRWWDLTCVFYGSRDKKKFLEAEYW